MRIYSMTATFGKLEHETLTLKPGMNVIHAPNEWGKSTWCAFLTDMLYGIDTRSKSTKTVLADKERYAPWSGSPMSGRIDLNWNGKDITIERNTRGRLIFGEFRAYETASGLDIPELDGSNCGAVLLGVERSVFLRAGFLRLADLPVTQDDALRRRLNHLVTTGDESGAGDKLQKSLKDLKNKCRYNRTGLLPQAEAQRTQLQGQLDELRELSAQTERLRGQQTELEARTAALKNHKQALRYAAAQADAARVGEAQKAEAEAQAVFRALQARCDGLPDRHSAEKSLRQGQQLRQQLFSLEMDAQGIPQPPQQPAVPARYESISPERARDMARSDAARLETLKKSRKKQTPMLWILAAVAILAGVLLLFRSMWGWGLLAAGTLVLLSAGIVAVLTSRKNRRLEGEITALTNKYPGIPVGDWEDDAQSYASAQQRFTEEVRQRQAALDALRSHRQALNAQIAAFSPDNTLEEALEQIKQNIACWDALENAARELRQAEGYTRTLQDMAKTAEPAPLPDTLTLSDDETNALLASTQFELQQLQRRLGQIQGRSEALGQESALQSQLRAVRSRIDRLEDIYAALELAQNALSEATAQLQRRFAPRISRRAQELFGALTHGRYTRLTLAEDLGLHTCAEGEDTLRASLWRSDGTVDQLYFALRLAVAEELTPEAPLILDDALVRFDDERARRAMDILRRTAQNKQVILFTCQSRETQMEEDS